MTNPSATNAAPVIDNKYSYLVTKVKGSRVLSRSKSRNYSVQILNTGSSDWYDIKNWKRAGSKVDIVGPFINDPVFLRDFKVHFGIGEKTDKGLYKITKLSITTRKLADSPVVEGDKVEIVLSLKPKRFARSGLHNVPLKIGKPSSEIEFNKENENDFKVYVRSYRRSLKYLIRAAKLFLIKPGKIQREFKNMAASSEANSQAVVMCTWKRPENLIKTEESLKHQVGKKIHLYLWNNNSDLGDELDDFATKSSLPITIFHSSYNIGGFGRFYAAKLISKTNKSVVFIDDDQFPDKNSIATLTKELKPKTAFGVFAHNFTDSTNYWHKKDAQPGKSVDYVGTGGMICDTQVFNNEEIFRCPKRYWFIEDLWLSYVMQHRYGYSKFKSAAQIEMKVDGKNQQHGLIDQKTDFYKKLLEQGWSISSNKNYNKVFVVGLSKTGTTSISEALEILGISSLHYPNTIEEIDRYDSASDLLVANNYMKLDKMYPGSKFILTTRDNEAWISSMQKHIEKLVVPKKGTTAYWLRFDAFGSAEYDRKKMLESFKVHNDSVRKYFSQRQNDFMELDISDSPGWEPICEFLSLEVPADPFPHTNIESQSSIQYSKSSSS